MNLAVFGANHPLYPMERLHKPVFTKIGGYPSTVVVIPPSSSTRAQPVSETADSDATDVGLPTSMVLHRFRFQIPFPWKADAFHSITRPIPNWVVITLFAPTKDDAVQAIVDGRLQKVAPWVPSNLAVETTPTVPPPLTPP